MSIMDSSDIVKVTREEAILDLQDYIANNFKKLPIGLHFVKFTFVNGGFRRPVLPKQDQEYVRQLLEAMNINCGKLNRWTGTVTFGMAGRRLTGNVSFEVPMPH